MKKETKIAYDYVVARRSGDQSDVATASKDIITLRGSVAIVIELGAS